MKKVLRLFIAPLRVGLRPPSFHSHRAPSSERSEHLPRRSTLIPEIPG